MKTSPSAILIGILILFVGLIILPIYYQSIIDWRDDMNTVQQAGRNFVDKVIDAGVITEDMLEDLNLEIAGCKSSFSYKYYRETKVTNPANTESGYTTTWEYAEIKVGQVWEQGDIVTIVITQNSLGAFQKLSAGLMGNAWAVKEVRLAGMVR